MTIESIIAERGIGSILHFTTNQGALGILDRKAVLPRARLGDDVRLAKIFYPNASDRVRDLLWHDYVNLSISRINKAFFAVSAKHWHKDQDFWWCVLDFSPTILLHDGVYFTTTNNMYSGVVRTPGANGLEAAFAPTIKQWHSRIVTRSNDCDAAHTTCPQAEVLYPGELSTRFLQHIYVSADEYADELTAQMNVVDHPPVSILVRPEIFATD